MGPQKASAREFVFQKTDKEISSCIGPAVHGNFQQGGQFQTIPFDKLYARAKVSQNRPTYWPNGANKKS
jgi:hypothetical protein